MSSRPDPSSPVTPPPRAARKLRNAADTHGVAASTGSAHLPSELVARLGPEVFAAVTHPRLRALAERGIVRRYRRDTVLMEEGDVGNVLVVVLAGRLRAFSTAQANAQATAHLTRAFMLQEDDEPDEAAAERAVRREITYGVYGPGDLLGEMALDGGPRSASVITLTTSVCSVIHRNVVQAYVAEEPEFAFDLLARVIAKARHATTSARNLALTDAYGRLSELLVTRAKTQVDGSVLVEEKMTQQDIAQRIGCSREMVSRLLKDLESGGYLQVRERRIYLVRKLPARW